jgi:hypothetical protein
MKINGGDITHEKILPKIFKLKKIVTCLNTSYNYCMQMLIKFATLAMKCTDVMSTNRSGVALSQITN